MRQQVQRRKIIAVVVAKPSQRKFKAIVDISIPT